MTRTSAVFRGNDGDFQAVLALLGCQGVDDVHRFTPVGCSWSRVGDAAGPLLVILHSWPEHGLVTVDVWAPALVSLEALERHGWRRVA